MSAARELELALPFDQRHLAENVLAALDGLRRARAAARARAARAPRGIVLSRWRGEELPLPGGGFVVNDAYNANPTSMRAALLDLAERAGGRRRVAILGEMAELGAESERYHREIGALLAELGVDALVAVGERGARVHDARRAARCTGSRHAPTASRTPLRPGDAVLVKASRAVGLEGVPARMANIAEAWSES